MSKLSAYLESVGLPGSEPLLRQHGWDVQIAQREGKDIAVVCTKGSELHFVSLHEKHAMTRKNVLAAIEPIYREFGFFSTRVPIAVTDHKLRRALGMTYQWHDDKFTYWSATRLPFQKAKP